MAADAENHKLFTEACRKNLDTYQSLYDDSSKSLYARVDLIYNFVCNQELKNYRASFSGGLHALMNPLMIFTKIIKLRWIHILSYDQ
ncbi:hypothetical protein Q4R21_18495, partial [Morganella morganii]